MSELEFLGEGICDGCGRHVGQLVAVDGAPLAGGALCLQCSDEGYLLELARELDEADRLGAERDVSEGARYVQISGALAEMWAERLREIAARIAETRAEEYLVELAQALDDTVRVETACWVQFSDALVKMTAERLREIAARIAGA